ncbi:MAG: 3-oxoacyl-[acyl-carrier-protein] reductase [Clostridiales bacterium]|nr:3-oxoacyl-[acyl-carrier-protein] reductase [Clostridiales bacterium]
MKVAIVTGAGRGIGRSIAEVLANEGYNLVLNYRSNKDELEQFVQTLKTKVLLVQGDVSDYADAERIIKITKDTFGQIDLLVNNAGITRDNLLIKMTEEEFDSVSNTNLKGTFNCTKHIARIMMKQRFGRIVNIASVVGITGNIGQANYAASKAGVIGFTKSVARELAPRGITVNAIAPGFIKTKMTDAISDEAKSAALSKIPLGTFGTPEDVANVVAFLASDKAAYITGQVIKVDGGMAI